MMLYDVARIHCHYLAPDNAENMAWCETKECEKQPVLKMSTLIKMQFMTFLNSTTTNNWDELCLRPIIQKI